MQASLTVAVRYGATRHQFGPPGSSEIAVLDYASQQLKLMPMLSFCYALHFTGGYLVKQYAEMKRTKDEDLIADVHALSAGPPPLAGACPPLYTPILARASWQRAGPLDNEKT